MNPTSRLSFPAARSKIALRAALHRLGFDLVRALPSDDLLRRRLKLIERHGTTVIFDVGANAGQYSITMRALGYAGRIVSFEPLQKAFSLLSKAAAADPGWETVNCALGEREGEVAINVSANLQSSSILDMMPIHERVVPESRYIGQEKVRMSTLASEIKERTSNDDRLFLKIDTQGLESRVISGAGNFVDRIVGIQLELALVPLYDGQPLMEELIAKLRELGFSPMSLEPGTHDQSSGRLLEVDGLFFREGQMLP